MNKNNPGLSLNRVNTQTMVWYKCPVCKETTHMNNNSDRKNGHTTCSRCFIERDYQTSIRDWFNQGVIALYDKTGTLPVISAQYFDEIKKAVSENNYKELCKILSHKKDSLFHELYCLLSGDNNVPLRDDLIKEFFDKKQQLTIFDMEV